ncbi:hypothetical protein Pcinc_020334 [Petrolisthes cinctipes]|uniref:Uncharacterized protein n=1 Tax=Petrolisthes cinctipes TaxID=88211 RepID=A0AAE1FIB3_PETCI|nr:hypothetical protein Pcinc_020334 [Petrolisthes cinctipes]
MYQVGRTPLHYATEQGEVQLAILLLQHGASIDYRDATDCRVAGQVLRDGSSWHDGCNQNRCVRGQVWRSPKVV